MNKCDELIKRGFSNINNKEYWETLYNDCMNFLKDENISQQNKEKLLKTNMESISMMYKSYL